MSIPLVKPSMGGRGYFFYHDSFPNLDNDPNAKHEGVDINGLYFSPVIAVAYGHVKKIGIYGSGNSYIIVDHDVSGFLKIPDEDYLKSYKDKYGSDLDFYKIIENLKIKYRDTDHKDFLSYKFKSAYVHMRMIIPEEKDEVEKGEIIGFMGGVLGEPGAGSTTGIHLHFALGLSGYNFGKNLYQNNVSSDNDLGRKEYIDPNFTTGINLESTNPHQYKYENDKPIKRYDFPIWKDSYSLLLNPPIWESYNINYAASKKKLNIFFNKLIQNTLNIGVFDKNSINFNPKTKFDWKNFKFNSIDYGNKYYNSGIYNDIEYISSPISNSFLYNREKGLSRFITEGERVNKYTFLSDDIYNSSKKLVSLKIENFVFEPVSSVVNYINDNIASTDKLKISFLESILIPLFGLKMPIYDPLIGFIMDYESLKHAGLNEASLHSAHLNFEFISRLIRLKKEWKGSELDNLFLMSNSYFKTRQYYYSIINKYKYNTNEYLRQESSSSRIYLAKRMFPLNYLSYYDLDYTPKNKLFIDKLQFKKYSVTSYPVFQETIVLDNINNNRHTVENDYIFVEGKSYFKLIIDNKKYRISNNQKATLEDCIITNCDLSNFNLINCTVIDSTLIDCNIDSCRADKYISNSIINNCNINMSLIINSDINVSYPVVKQNNISSSKIIGGFVYNVCFTNSYLVKDAECNYCNFNKGDIFNCTLNNCTVFPDCSVYDCIIFGGKIMNNSSIKNKFNLEDLNNKYKDFNANMNTLDIFGVSGDIKNNKVSSGSTDSDYSSGNSSIISSPTSPYTDFAIPTPSTPPAYTPPTPPGEDKATERLTPAKPEASYTPSAYTSPSGDRTCKVNYTPPPPININLDDILGKGADISSISMPSFPSFQTQDIASQTYIPPTRPNPMQQKQEEMKDILIGKTKFGQPKDANLGQTGNNSTSRHSDITERLIRRQLINTQRII